MVDKNVNSELLKNVDPDLIKWFKKHGWKLQIVKPNKTNIKNVDPDLIKWFNKHGWKVPNNK